MDKQLKEQGENTRSGVYGFIVDFITSNGYSPSIREIADGVGRSTATVHDQLIMLEQMNMIRTQEKKSRTISLVGFKFRKKT